MSDGEQTDFYNVSQDSYSNRPFYLFAFDMLVSAVLIVTLLQSSDVQMQVDAVRVSLLERRHPGS